MQQVANVRTGGRRIESAEGYFMPPTIMSEVTTNMTIANEEVFGPVLSAFKYDNSEQAIEICNGTEYGLAAGFLLVIWLKHTGQHRVCKRGKFMSINGMLEELKLLLVV